MERPARPSSRALASAASAVSVSFVALVAATPGSPFQPVLPRGARPAGPITWVAEQVGLDTLRANALAWTGAIAVGLAAAAFLLVLREAWRGSIPVSLVVGLAISYHVVMLALPLLFSRDVYSYAYYGRIAVAYHANPYVVTPADFPHDALARFVGPRWVHTPAVYGPLWTQVSGLVDRIATDVPAAIAAFRLLVIGASLATLGAISFCTTRLWPARRAFALAAFGLNPVVLFQSVASGHNDLLVALGIAGALAFVAARRERWATAVLTLAALVKATAFVPLVILVAVVVARRSERRWRALLSHLALVVGIALVFAAPFLQKKDPSLGMVELATHEGWLAPSRLFRRVLDAASSGALGVVARVAFPALLAAALFVVVRALVRGRDGASPSAIGAGWGWGLIALMLLGPVLLPWYVTWALPLVWLLPSVPRAVLVGTSAALTVSQFTAEPSRLPAMYDANLLWGHYVVSPIVIALLAWLLVDLWRRARSDAPLEDQPREVSAAAGDR